MCTMGQCERNMGRWMEFRTPWGKTRGIVEQVNHRAVLVRVPKEHAPVVLLNNSQSSDEARLDVTLAQNGYPSYGAGGGYGGGEPGYGGGARWGYPGYYRWVGPWLFWWLAFAWIFWLLFLF
jgi:hypothetical protein